MMYRPINFVLAMIMICAATQAVAEDEWALKGNLAESCCCQAACPCIFQSAPTLGHCEGSSLFEIEKGNYEDVKVDGLNVVFSYRFGEWVRVYVDESASEKQVDAVVNLLNQAKTFGAFFAGDAKLLSAETTKVSVRKSETKIEFSVPDAKVRLERVPGADGGPIQINNLTIPWFLNGYTQYKATTTSYDGDDNAFEYAGTNGATSHIDAKGGDDD